MKLLFASDIHGSAAAMEKIKERFLLEKADKLILLGDLLYHGPRNPLPEGYDPKAVAAIINALKQKTICVRGNCDADVDQLLLEIPITADNLLVLLGRRTLFITHGHKLSFDELPYLNKGDLFMQGHTHIKVSEEKDGIVLLNPGSAALPKDGSAGSYMVYEDDAFIHKDLSGSELGRLALS